MRVMEECLSLGSLCCSMRLQCCNSQADVQMHCSPDTLVCSLADVAFARPRHHSPFVLTMLEAMPRSR